MVRTRLLWKALPAALMCVIVFIVSCAPRKAVKKSAGAEGLDDIETSGVLGPEVDAAEAAIRGKEFREVSDLQTIYFDYDQYSLSDQAHTALQRNADYLKDHPDLEILVEGHCDERGTIEYNLALGQKRAASVRDYYIRLGVPGKTIATISFGEERSACSERTDACWAKNRRAVNKIRAQVSSAPAAGDSVGEIP